MIAADLIFLELKATSKKHLIQQLAFKAADLLGLKGQDLMEVLLDRERIGSTGIGYGVAIPHIKLPELNQVHGVFARLEDPVDFESVDDRPIDLVYLLLAPENSSGLHLRALARVSRLMRDQSVCMRLRNAEDAFSITGIFEDWARERDIAAA